MIIKQIVEFSKLENAPAMTIKDLSMLASSLGSDGNPIKIYMNLVKSLEDASAPDSKKVFQNDYFDLNLDENTKEVKTIV